jgi:hypothetical protein
MHSFSTEWEPTSMAPSDRDLEICVLDYDGIVHTFPVACHRTGQIGSTLGVRGTSISSRPIGATGVNSTSRRAEQPRKLQDGTCESRAICWRGRQRLSA